MIPRTGITLGRYERLKSWLYSPLIALLAIRRAPAGQQHTPKSAFVAGAHDHTASSGKQVDAPCSVLNLRALSMGKRYHEITGTSGAWDRNRWGNPRQAQGGCADQPERR
jgi:2-methylaconitate cis-trans-isomerase PrpF